MLEYEGTAYAGFQRQANAASVQATVEGAIESLTSARTRLEGAGRTDAGVHALGQVVAFDTDSMLPLDRVQEGLNHYLPEDIAAVAAYEMPEGFDPRREAVARVYRYTFQVGRSRSPLRHRFVHAVRGPLAIVAMAEALTSIEGDRDFASFAGTVEKGKSTRRLIIRTAVWREDAEVHVEIEGNAFLYQQVRRTAGALLRVGTGKLTVDGFAGIAENGRPGEARWVLPAQGLCLREVRYRGFPPDN